MVMHVGFRVKQDRISLALFHNKKQFYLEKPKYFFNHYYPVLSRGTLGLTTMLFLDIPDWSQLLSISSSLRLGYDSFQINIGASWRLN